MSASYSEEFIERVRDANNIVEIVSQYTQLKASGHQHMGRCPFPDHPEKTPSFSVSEDKQVYHCFGCKKSGNIYTFLQIFNGMSFPEAVEYLARRASIPLPVVEEKQQIQRGKSQDEKALLLKINKHAGIFFHKQLLAMNEKEGARAYAEKRGLSQEIIEKFRLGYAPAEWGSLVQYFQKLKVPLHSVEKLGLIRSKSGGRSGHFDFFRDRLMFPIFSPMGEVIGFGGRILGEGQPKYLNSPETPLFSKGRTLYGLHETAKFIRAVDQAIVVEGYMDFLALYRAGVTNVVATLGTALTPEHAKLLKRYTPNILVLFDGDAAGQDAADKSLSTLLQAGLFAKGLTLPGGLDPDDYLAAHGEPAFRELLAQAPDLFSVYVRRLMNDYHGTASDKVRIIDQVGPVLIPMADRRLLDLYIRDLAERLNVERDWVVRALKEFAAKQAKPESKTETKQATPVNLAGQAEKSRQAKPSLGPEDGKIRVTRPPRPESILLNLALKNEDYLKEIRDRQVVDRLSHPALKQVMLRLLDAYRQRPNDFDSLTALLVSQVEPASIVTQHLEPSFAAAGKAEDLKLLQDCCKTIQDHFLKAQAKALALELREHPSAEQLEQFMNIQRDRHLLRKDPNEH